MPAYEMLPFSLGKDEFPISDSISKIALKNQSCVESYTPELGGLVTCV
jgi:hypothetical protein